MPIHPLFVSVEGSPETGIQIQELAGKEAENSSYLYTQNIIVIYVSDTCRPTPTPNHEASSGQVLPSGSRLRYLDIEHSQAMSPTYRSRDCIM